MKTIEKGAGYEGYFLPAELASYLGTTTRSIRRWMLVDSFPKPSARNDKGYKLWSPEDVRKVLEWRLKRV